MVCSLLVKETDMYCGLCCLLLLLKGYCFSLPCFCMFISMFLYKTYSVISFSLSFWANYWLFTRLM